MEREIEVEVSLEGLRVQENPMFCQGDKNTHFINIKFMEDVVLCLMDIHYKYFTYRLFHQ